MQSPEENKNLINEFSEDANQAVTSSEFVKKLGGLTVFAGIFDFLCIQVARAMEQAIIKIDWNQKRPFRVKDPGAPHEDSFFYDNHISTRRILKQVKGFLPHITSHDDLKKYIIDMCKHGEDFLNNRITAIHYVGNPRISRNKMEEAVENALFSYKQFITLFHDFRKEIHPFTFSEKEKTHFYKHDKTKGIIVMAEKINGK